MDYTENPIIKTFDQIDDGHTDSSIRPPLLFRFSSLEYFGSLKHGVFSRLGGISQPPYQSLNTSYHPGDRSEHVKSNLELIRRIMGADQLIFTRQAHDRNIFVIERAVSEEHMGGVEADALMTTIPGSALVVKLADCQGAILFDPVQKVLSVVHCGWRGHVKNIYGHVVDKMKNRFHCHPTDIRAAIGPSLGPCCAEFKTYKELFPESFLDFMEKRYYFNLWELGRRQLTEAGIIRENIDIARICTRCRTDLFYSYRGETRTGRFAMVAMLNE